MANLRTNAANTPAVFYETTANLGIDGEYKTPEELTATVTPAADDWIDLRGIAEVWVQVAANQVSADLGFTWDETPSPTDAAFTRNHLTATIAVDTPVWFRFHPHYRYGRAKYINGGVAQTSFVLFIQGIRA